MEFGFITGGSLDRLTEDAALAERSAFDRLGLADSQFLTNELYTNLGALARESGDVAIGPTMTNPVTRHPAVHASALCNLQDVSDGRAFLGLASGDSAVYTLGKDSARLSELERAVRVIKRLSRGETVAFDGTTIGLEWLDADRDYEFPVAMAAEGPKTLELAGRVADRVVVGLGKTPPVVETAVERIETGAAAAGRDPDDVAVDVFVDANVAETREAAIDEMKHSLAASAHHSLQFSFEGKCVPAEYEDRLQRLVAEYDSTVHGQPDRAANRRLVEELSLAPYLADRYAVAGTPEECRAQLREIAATGVDGVLMAVHTSEPRPVVERFGTEILPAL
jgi:5,10-methylenetetrahydromethanopterin reductase